MKASILIPSRKWFCAFSIMTKLVASIAIEQVANRNSVTALVNDEGFVL